MFWFIFIVAVVYSLCLFDMIIVESDVRSLFIHELGEAKAPKFVFAGLGPVHFRALS